MSQRALDKVIGNEANTYLLRFGVFNVSSGIDYENNLRDQDVRMYDCSLRFCGKSYAGLNFTNSTYNEAPPEEWDFESVSAEWTSINDDVYRNFNPPSSISGFTGNSSAKWTVNRSDWQSISTYLTQQFTSAKQTISDEYLDSAAPDQTVASQLYHSTNIFETMDNIATSMTNKIRNSTIGTPFQGKATRDQTKIRVRWPWMILPIVFVLARNVLLLLSILESSKHHTPLWRSSSLALLYHGLEKVPDGHAMATLSEMEESSTIVRVRLGGREAQSMKLVDV